MSTMLRSSICLTTVCLLVGLSALGASANERPNVIVIMADDIGAEGLACYGRTIYTTASNVGQRSLFAIDLSSGDVRPVVKEGTIRSPVLEEWGLETDEWTFILDATGRVTHRFEAFVPIEELEPALVSVIQN